jgi:hypothetical protein
VGQQRDHQKSSGQPFAILEEAAVMRRTLAGAVLAGALLAITGCGGASAEAPKYKAPGLGVKPRPAPGGPGLKGQPGTGIKTLS